MATDRLAELLTVARVRLWGAHTFQHLGQRTAPQWRRVDSTGGSRAEQRCERTVWVLHKKKKKKNRCVARVGRRLLCGRLGLGLFPFFLTHSASVVPIVSVGVPLDAWLNPEDVPSTVKQATNGWSSVVGVPKRLSIYKDAGGKCLETEMTRFVERHLNSCQIFVRRGKCRTNTAWILSTTSETLPGHDIRIQVKHNLHAWFNDCI